MRVFPLCAVALGVLVASCQAKNPAYRGPVTSTAADASPDATPDATPGDPPRAMDVAGPSIPDAPVFAPDARQPRQDVATEAAPIAEGAISGTIRGSTFPVAEAVWIGRPSSATTVVFLLQAPVSCVDLGTSGWDVPLGTKQILELDINGTTARSYQIGMGGSSNYQSGATNPSASAGSITIDTIEAASRIAGSFNLTFGADKITGTFSASYCAAGVEP